MEANFPRERLGDYCLKIGSGATPKGGKEVYIDEGEIALIRSQNVYNNHFATDGLAYLTPEAAQKLDSVTVEEDDILLNITGDSVARCCSVPNYVLPARVNQHVAIIRPKPDEFVPRYIQYFLVSPNQQDRMLKLARFGATRNALTKAMIEDFTVPKPNIEIQRSITKILGDLDDKIDLLREINRTLEQIVRAVFRAWFVDFEPVRAKAAGANSFRGMPQEVFDSLPADFDAGQIPSGWRTDPLAKLVRLPIGRGLTPKYIETGGVAVLNQKCVRNWEVDFSLARRHDNNAKPPKEKVVEQYDILVNSTGVGTLGRVAQVYELPEVATVDSHLSLVKPDPEKIAPLVAGFELTNREQEIERLGHGSTGQTELSRQKLGELLVVVPALETQNAFVSLVMPFILRKVSNFREIETLNSIRNTLLPKLISGELEAPGLQTLGLKAVGDGG